MSEIKGLSRFKKGQSGNPGGRPKEAVAFKEWCRKFAEKEGKNILLKWARSSNAKASVQAVTLLYAYGLGKPTEHHEHSGSISIEQLLSDSRT